MKTIYRNFLIRDWQPHDRTLAAELIQSVLTEYGLTAEPAAADHDVFQVEDAYWRTGGEFWVVEWQGRLVGTAAFYPVSRGQQAVEIRKMYLLPESRGQGLGTFLLQTLEQVISDRGFQQIWVETASRLKEAVKLYERSGYQITTGVETARCDRIYTKFIGQAIATEAP